MGALVRFSTLPQDLEGAGNFHAVFGVRSRLSEGIWEGERYHEDCYGAFNGYLWGELYRIGGTGSMVWYVVCTGFIPYGLF